MKRYTLIYGGREFDLGDSDYEILDKPHETPGSIKMNLGDRGWLTIAVGPAIPIAIIEKDKGESKPTATVL